MKTYEKPKLMALSLSGNDRLCGACAQEGSMIIYGNDLLGSQILIAAGRMDLISDGITQSDFKGAFGLGEACELEISGYCKFTSQDSIMVAWS